MKKSLVFIFLAQFVAFFLIVINTRAYTGNNYSITAISDIIWSTLNFFVIRKIAQDAFNIGSLIAYTAGGTIGSLLAMYISSNYLNI